MRGAGGRQRRRGAAGLGRLCLFSHTPTTERSGGDCQGRPIAAGRSGSQGGVWPRRSNTSLESLLLGTGRVVHRRYLCSGGRNQPPGARSKLPIGVLILLVAGVALLPGVAGRRSERGDACVS